jgi:hypothetical protein
MFKRQWSESAQCLVNRQPNECLFGNFSYSDSYSKFFLIRKREFFEKIKENEELCGGVYEDTLHK